MKKISKWIGVLTIMMIAGMLFKVNTIEHIHAGQSVDGYTALDSSDPIEFGGSYIVYKGQKLDLGAKAIYLDGSLSDAEVAKYPYVYNDVTKALSAAALTNGSEDAPMVVYIAPYVYWIDNPQATDTVQKTDGYDVPYGMVVNCQWLQLTGLTTDPYNVVLAGNRGQSNGSNGNYTMFRFNGDGLNTENLTIGNYCSVDLTYNLKPSLSVAKRTATITQAQLADMSGDKMFAENCNFISRLNLDPIGGATRALYNKCHFESTDDSLNGNAVYQACNFDFYGNRPLYWTYNTGATFLGCTFNCKDLNVEAEPYQYFTKEGGTVTAVDCQYKSNFAIPFGLDWTKYPAKSLKCYQYNILHNGQQTILGGKDATETVDMSGKPVLSAYRFEQKGTVYYNTYNLLRGSDDWDPLHVKDAAIAAGATNIPTMLSVSTSADTIESGVSTASLSSKVQYFYGTQDTTAKVSFSLSAQDANYVKLIDHQDGTCTVVGINNEDDTKNVVINATTDTGLVGAVALSVSPSVLAAPAVISQPTIQKDQSGKLKVNYTLDLGTRADQSLISWYRCTDAQGSNPILVAVTRSDDPQYEYTLTAGDIGYYIMAKVEPKDIRSNAGSGIFAISTDKIKMADIKTQNLYTDFENFPTISQPQVLPGFWTVDCYKPLDTAGFSNWTGSLTVDPWIYGTTGNGSVGYGLYQGTQGARLMYTPVQGTYGDMSLEMVVDPAKTAGQGFGSAGQYMDVCLKFDTTTLTGYGLRMIRTKAASNATTFVLVKYQNGQVTEISKEILASCFATGCKLSLKIENGKFTAHVETPTAQLADQTAAGYVHSVDLSADVESNGFGGIAIQHTGTTGSGGWQNTTMLHSVRAEWFGTNNQNPVVTTDNQGSGNNEQQPTISSQDTTDNSNLSAQVSEVSAQNIQTGDSSRYVFWAVLAMVSLIFIALAGGKVRRFRKVAKR